QDLGVPPRLLEQDLLPPGDKPAQYILTSMPAADSQAWFGKAPPDLSLMARARGQDYLYQFLRTFYVDPASQTGANNLRLPATAMQSEEHTSELQSHLNLVCRLLLEKKKKYKQHIDTINTDYTITK